VHIETYQGRDGPGTKLVGRVSDVELAGGDDRQEQQAAPKQAVKPAPKQSQQSGPPAGHPAASGFETMDDDIPF